VAGGDTLTTRPMQTNFMAQPVELIVLVLARVASAGHGCDDSGGGAAETAQGARRPRIAARSIALRFDRTVLPTPEYARFLRARLGGPTAAGAGAAAAIARQNRRKWTDDHN
jgi:hypothetical protein